MKLVRKTKPNSHEGMVRTAQRDRISASGDHPPTDRTGDHARMKAASARANVPLTQARQKAVRHTDSPGLPSQYRRTASRAGTDSWSWPFTSAGFPNRSAV